MTSPSLRMRTALQALATALLLLTGAVLADSAKIKALTKLYEKGVRLHNMGKEKEAAEVFEQMVGLNPSPEDALEFRDKVGVDNLVTLFADKRFRKQIQKILDLSYDEFSRLRKEVKEIRSYVKQLGDKSSEKVWQAVFKLSRLGPFAVPYLLDPLVDFKVGSPDSIAVGARIALRYMGERATPPLVQALKARTRVKVKGEKEEEALEDRDVRLKVEVCKLLRASRDRRALPMLLAVARDSKEHMLVRQSATEACVATWRRMCAAEGKKGGAPPWPTAEQAFIRLAELYAQDAPEVMAFVSRADRVIWRWREESTRSYAKRLIHERPPLYLYGRALAQQTLLEGMARPHRTDWLLALYAANNYMMIYIAEEAAQDPDATKAERDRAAALVKQLSYIYELNEQLGARVLYLALGRALKLQSPPLALHCIAGLRSLRDPRPLPERKALFAAVRSKFRSVRTSAAEAILRISPDGGLLQGAVGEVDAVSHAMYELLTSAGKPRVLVITPNLALYRDLKPLLRKWGLEPERSLDLPDGARRAQRPMPTVDLILVDVITGLDVFLPMLRRDVRTRRIPVIVLAEEKKTPAFATESGVPVVTYQPKGGVLPTLLREAVEKAVSADRQAREDVDERTLRRALTTLAWVPADSVYKVNMRKFAPPLIALLEESPAGVVAVSLELLAQLGDTRAFDPACRIFLVPGKPKELRVRAGKTVSALIWRLKAAPGNEIIERLKELATGKDRDLRILAVHALGKARLNRKVLEEAAVKTAESHLLWNR